MSPRLPPVSNLVPMATASTRDRAGARAARGRPRRRRGRVRAAGRALPGRAPRPLLPDARLGPRRRGRAPGGAAARLARAGAVRGPQLAALVALPIATNTCLDAIERRPKRVLPIDYGPAADPHDGPGEPLVESVWVEPYPDERLGLEDGFAGAGGPLRAARERRARLHRRASEPAAQPARRADPARGARLLREGGRRDRSRRPSPRSTAPSSAPARPSRSGFPSRASRQTLRSLGDEGLREVVDGYVDAWQRGDVEAVVGMLTEDAALRDAAARHLVPRPRGDRVFLAGWPLSGLWRWRRSGPARTASRRSPSTAGTTTPGLPAVRAQRAHASRRADQRRHCLHRAVHAGARPRGDRAAAGAAGRSPAAHGRLRELRPTRAARLTGS